MSGGALMGAVAFWVLAVAAVACAVTVFVVDSMARATFALLASFLFGAGEIILLGLDYLGVVIVVMMIMEMVIMAVFMVMYMMNPAGLMPMSMVHNQRGSLLTAGTVFASLAAGIFLVPWPARGPHRPADPTFDLGKSLMGPHMLTMMLLGVTLFATMVVTVVLASQQGRYDRLGDDLKGKAR
ncbi:NADH-quinone oxidoreductase subunit J [Acidiferrimicrobium sp. IK]|jgi:NADH-quinone oxidoreductase subunit J|uniref:NADH-quinone oxidoreductase subunit J n=1 Tax=Acidiferrimicrobium sp. IK TaxID=2871700 RepID=UPI0021CB5418|nr:NADH-quinone oxidoreductase subunit J [Acidiferrimicrobium sp. IK]MCU4185729.1 NADH-quinone oxidoreductase subunit J [Acidiferrimicrobium sp. IK]